MLSVQPLIVAASSAPAGDKYAGVDQELSSDAVFRNCQIHSAAATTQDVLTEFACVYRARDYRAAELLGEALLHLGVNFDQRDLYWLANSFYKRGNNGQAMTYARQAYSRLSSKDKSRCQSNINRCAELRRLLVAIQPSYRVRFADEDSAIESARRETEVEAAEATREAAATAFDDSGSGIHSTETFRVNGSWELQWSYDCSNFSDSGNFIVEVQGDVSDVLVNQLGSGDSGTEYVHRGGNVYLEINSECDWTVKAVNE
jgi:hypothetical protein